MSFVVRQITDVQNIYRIDGNRCESNVLCVCKIRLLSQLLAEEIMFLLNLTDGHSNYRVALLLNNIFSIRLIGFFDEIGNRKVRLCVAKVQICKNGSVMKKGIKGWIYDGSSLFTIKKSYGERIQWAICLKYKSKLSKDASIFT